MPRFCKCLRKTARASRATVEEAPLRQQVNAGQAGLFTFQMTSSALRESCPTALRERNCISAVFILVEDVEFVSEAKTVFL